MTSKSVFLDPDRVTHFVGNGIDKVAEQKTAIQHFFVADPNFIARNAERVQRNSFVLVGPAKNASAATHAGPVYFSAETTFYPALGCTAVGDVKVVH